MHRDSEVRLVLADRSEPSRNLDGAWWPRSNVAATEFPELIIVLRSRFGDVARIGYDLDTWGEVAVKSRMNGRTVHFDGFHHSYAGTKVLIGAGGRRRTLMMIPPATVEAQASALLATAEAPGMSRAALAKFLATAA